MESFGKSLKLLFYFTENCKEVLL